MVEDASWASEDEPAPLHAGVVVCPQCGAEVGVACRWQANLSHLVSNSHWARRAVLEGAELVLTWKVSEEEVARG